MPLHIEFDDYTPAQIAAAGNLPGVHASLITRALMGPLHHLQDGRIYVIRIHPRNPQPIAAKPGQHRIQVEIRWLVGEVSQAQIGEVVPGHLLTADDKGPGVQRFEATWQGRRFDPDPEGWRRVT